MKNGTKLMAKQTDDTDIFSLLEEIEKRKQPAIDALLKEREELDNKLARLGYQHPSVAPATPQKRPAKAHSAPKAVNVGPSGNYDAGKKCPICDGMISHDGRAHRSQNPKNAHHPTRK